MTAWRGYSSLSSASPKAWMDAYLAAFAKMTQATLITRDNAFHTYPGIDVHIIESLNALI